MSADDEVPVIVIDNGSSMCKAGFAGDDAPRAVISSCVGRLRRTAVPVLAGLVVRDTFIGDVAQSRRGILSLQYPINHGIVCNWDDMQKIWHSLFYSELIVAPDEHPVLLTEAVLNPKRHSEVLLQTMFEVFDTPALSIDNPAFASLAASGRTTGVVLECGDGVTQVVSCIEGKVFANATFRMDLGGRDLTEYMAKLLQVGVGFPTTDLEEIREVKEKLGLVALDYELQMNDSVDRSKSSLLNGSCVLSDGSEISIAQERFRCAEPLFQPSILGLDGIPGIAEMIFKSIASCDIDQRKDLYRNIVLSGGSTLFPGFAERVEKEIIALAPKSTQVKVVALPERKYGAWIGCSILASLSTFQSACITKAEYDEIGPSVVHKKRPVYYN